MKLEVLSREPETDPRPTPVLFVHGALHAAWCWEENFMPRFAQHGYRSYAMSFRGHGSSEGHRRIRWISMREYSEDIEQVVGEIEPSPIIVAHSMGALAAQRYLEERTAPAAVLMTSIPNHGLLPFMGRYGRKHPFRLIRSYATLDFYYAVRRPELARELFWSSDMPRDLVERYFARIQQESARAVIDMQFFTFPRPHRVGGIPMMVMGARDDAFFTEEEIRATAKAYGTEPIMFPHMAHDMMLEVGWEGVADRIIEWLKEMDF